MHSAHVCRYTDRPQPPSWPHRRHYLSLAASLLALAFWVATTAVAQAGTIIVDASCTFAEAIRAANSDSAVNGCAAGNSADTIVLEAGKLYELTAVDNTFDGDDDEDFEPIGNGLPPITSTLTISGNGATIARASAEEFRILFVSDSGNLTLHEVTIRNGYIDFGAGGGIINLGLATIINSQIVSNTTFNGGGIYNGGTVTVTNSYIFSNTATSGGGISNDGAVNVLNTYISSNTAIGGGGIYNGGTVTVTNSYILSNTTNIGGGAIQNNNGVVTVTGGQIRANKAGRAAGGILSRGTLIISGTQIIANRAPEEGGALFSSEATGTNVGSSTITESCIVGNSNTAIFRDSGPSIIATDNWWGATDGPGGEGPGSGDSVSSNVDFTNFKTTSILGCLIRDAFLLDVLFLPTVVAP